MVHTRGVERGLAGEDGVDFYSDYRGVPVIGAFKWLPEYNMCMITEVEQAEAYGAIYSAGWPILGTMLVIVAAVIVVGLLVARDITLPLHRLVAGTDEIGRGNLDCRVGIQSPDELGELSRAFDRMVEKLKSTTISLDELEVKVRQRTERLDEVNRELEAFAYSVSHDLRAPLRAINGFISILLEEYEQKLDAEGRRICAVIADSARNMGTLIDDLLAFSRSGRVEINSMQIDMEKLARSVFDELTDPRQRQHIQLHVGALPPAVADRTLIHQVWVNLISNAIKFSAGRETPVISIDGESLNGENIYRVQDNGEI
jgi:signal transduction histidine kinase